MYKLKLAPESTAAKIRLTFLVILLLSVASFYRLDQLAFFYLSDKKEGDILFQSLPHCDLVDAIETTSDSEWSHCGILVKRNDEWVVGEAIGEVRYTPLYLWVVRGRHSKVSSYRLKDFPNDKTSNIQIGINKLLGLPYDFHYAPDDSQIYCSELVYKVYERELGIKIGDWQKLGDLNWKPMESFIRAMEAGGLPLERKIITPVELTHSDLVNQVY